MKKTFLIIATALTGFMANTATAQTVDELVDKHVQAMGGADKLNNLKSVKISSSMQMMGTDLTQNLTIIDQKAFRQDIIVQGMTMVQVIDGNKGWGINPMVDPVNATPTPDEQVKMMTDQLDLKGSLVNYKAKGNTVELVGKENVGTAETYKLKIGKKNNVTEFINLDAKTYLPIRTTTIANVQGKEFKQETSSSNFQKVDGITFPFAVEVKGDALPGGGPVAVTVTKVEVNPTVDESIFKMPAKK
ncbi:LolA-like protein [Tellurirhabdus bombi]|uniref:outer membrane lipoprotein-sorting protein n=1 Tax=Tellurirhabdus bombi TaxID=2907205 RepID=UPI001F35B4E4|nr:outer membrane lipoprotein-sorting protein [Tellurirhabdus bombi]